ncbi:hypothetical protein CAEBREN_19965 [Caenorhabditis brenneri]|uniref:Uncharacterized protein n=1 Tax=Caenorhabditis brenneri TaxID=135651 RepID=G0P0H0_CAEBE|nr:hypothetical protein CAEBREN_19965 [Caenorhabditis brenneri]
MGTPSNPGSAEQPFNPSEDAKEPPQDSPSTSSGTPRRGPPYSHLKYVPLAQITTTVITGWGIPRFKVIIGSDPNEDGQLHPLHHLQVVEGFIQEDASGSPIHGLPVDPPKGRKKLEFTIMTINSWQRKERPATGIRCACHPRYTDAHEQHHDKKACRARALGAWISERLHQGWPLVGTPVPDSFLQPI